MYSEFLRSVNHTRPLLIGSPGQGSKRESLWLQRDQNYCMGGPGVILSAGLADLVKGNLTECLGELLTSHEDVERAWSLLACAHQSHRWCAN